MTWNTAISTSKDGELFVRGTALSTLIKERTFSEVAFLLLAGRLPTERECRLFDAMLVAAAEHGVAAPSAYAARVSASTGNPLHIAAAAGILSIGDHHGGAVEEAARLFANRTSAQEVIASGKRFPGFGHKVYTEVDPRAELLCALADDLSLAGEHVAHARKIHAELQQETGKTLPLNIDGALAALMLELSLDYRLGKALFAFARMPGMLAHALEEVQNEKPYRRLSDTDITYTGPAIDD